MPGSPVSSATDTTLPPGTGTPATRSLIVLADGTKLLPGGIPRRLAYSAWEIPTSAGPRLVRDADLWFSEATLAMPAGAAATVNPLLVGIQLSDGSRIEGSLTGVRIDHGATWLRWRHDGGESEVRITDAGLARAEISLRAAGVPRLNPITEPDANAVAPATSASPPAHAAQQPHLISSGFALLEDGAQLSSDAIPQQLSDGSWHLSIDGHTRVLPLEKVWLVETETAAPMTMIPVEAPMNLELVLPLGQRLEGELLNAYVDSEALWLHWRRAGRERTLRIAAPAIAGIELEMRPPRASGLTRGSGPDASPRLPLLRSGADLDAFLAAQLQGDGREVEAHLFADLATWQRGTTDERAAENSFRLAQKLGLTLIDLAAVEPSPPALSTLTPEVARRHRMVPLRIRQNLIAVATDNPTSAEALSTVEFATAKRVILMLAHGTAVQAAISRHYDRVEDSALLKSLVLGPETDEDDDRTARENERLARQQPIVRLVAALLEDAARRRASDIHVRPREDDFEVLYRVDGALMPVRSFAKPLLRAITSRIKVLGGMDISEHRLPQDGRIAFPFEGMTIDVRVSVLPSVNGESIVLRLLNSREGLRNLTQIGFSSSDEELFRNMLSRSHGMILVTGPTGCGKSTTLYAALLEARKQGVNIITVEDPVEYHIPDVIQIQTHKAIGFTFASTLRNILRHDPDVVMVGEIRDRETAEIAVESALTGHLLFSTLHTNSAATTVTRLIDLGVEAFLLRSTLLGVLAQRLARRNCRQCMEPEHVPPYMRGAMGVAESETFYRGIGCQHCGGTGIHGRTAVYELMHIDSEIRKLIVANVDGDSIHQRAVDAGMVPITARALALARSGVISLSEAYRIRVE